MVLFSAEQLPGIGTLAVFFVGLLLLLMLFTAFWPQVVLFEESNLHRLQNAILFCLKYGKHVIGTAILQLLVASVRVVFAVDGLSCAFPRCVVYLVLCFFLLYNDFNAPMALKKRSASSSRSRHPAMMNDKESNHGHFNDWRSFDRPDPDRQG